MEGNSWLDNTLRTILAVLAIVLVVSLLVRIVCLVGGWNSPEQLTLALRISAGVTALGGVLSFMRRPEGAQGGAGQQTLAGWLELSQWFVYALLAAIVLIVMSLRM